MQVIKQLAFVLEDTKVAKIDILDHNDSTNRHTEFYRLVKNGTITTDEQGVKYLYDINDVHDQRYRKFKLKLIEKLCNLIFFVDTNVEKVGDYQNTYSDAQKSWALINILYTRSMFIAATELSEQLLKICLQYEFTELIVQITDRLKYYYAVLEGDNAKYTYFREVHFKHLAYLNAEFSAKDVYEGIKIEYVKTVSFKRHMHDVALKAVEALRPLTLECDSFTFMSFWFYVRLSVSQVIYDHKCTIATCEEGLAFFEQKKFDTRKVTAVLFNQKLIAHIQLRQYEEAKKTARAVIPLQITGTHNWYKTLEQQMMLSFYTRAYGQAYDVYMTAIKNKGYGFLAGRNKEIWPLFGAYLYFLIKIKRIEGIALEKSGLKDFRPAKFFNELEQISLDKKGLNIPAFIINVVLQLSNDSKNRKNDLSESVEAMKKYIVRHVKKTDASFRSNAFMKLLVHVFEQDCNKKRIAPLADKIMSEISETSPDFMEQGDRVEILPFEYLWDEMQGVLAE